VAEQRRHRRVAAQGGAVELDELAADLVAGLLELEDLAGEAGLAGAGRAREQQRRLGRAGDLLDLRDQGVEGGVLGGDAGLEEGLAGAAVLGEAGGDRLVAREVEVDDRVRAGVAGVAAGRRDRLQQPPGQVARLGQQEQADLLDVRAGGDVKAQGSAKSTRCWRTRVSGETWAMSALTDSASSAWPLPWMSSRRSTIRSSWRQRSTVGLQRSQRFFPPVSSVEPRIPRTTVGRRVMSASYRELSAKIENSSGQSVRP
jgi:hypothetical protein